MRTLILMLLYAVAALTPLLAEARCGPPIHPQPNAGAHTADESGLSATVPSDVDCLGIAVDDGADAGDTQEQDQDEADHQTAPRFDGLALAPRASDLKRVVPSPSVRGVDPFPP